ncbi:MAG: T9SS type A sorting domain-containing protein [Bacteroidales bacterium]|nr:T9SS type A sorting domain-containing protein [Bacteroidales bacterium]
MKRYFMLFATMAVSGLVLQGQEPLSNRSAANPWPAASEESFSDGVVSTIIDGDANYVSKWNWKRCFIPDVSGNPLVRSIEFDEFGSDVVVTPEQVASVCITMEHSYIGDIRIELLCPTYDPAVSTTAGRSMLKAGVGTAPYYLGLPLEGRYDDSPYADSLHNPFGAGLAYCWSVNHDWTLVTGDSAHRPYDKSAALLINAPEVRFDQHQTHRIPDYFSHGGDTVTLDMSTTQPSNRIEHSNYYLPHDQFENLVGCPLNGRWSIRITDLWSGDNGWLFSWSMDLYSLEQEQEQEGIDLPTLDTETKLMPNPATDWVKVTSDKELRYIEIFDLQGRLLQNEVLHGNETDVDISRLSAGTYCARILTIEGRTARKLVVK